VKRSKLLPFTENLLVLRFQSLHLFGEVYCKHADLEFRIKRREHIEVYFSQCYREHNWIPAACSFVLLSVLRIHSTGTLLYEDSQIELQEL
jgi:hypothetical protein